MAESEAAEAETAAPETIVRRFLAEMEARDLDAARARLAPGFAMVFPGTAPMRTLEELIAWSKPRYSGIRKTFEAVETSQAPDGAAVVWCRGTLSGVWPDGAAFSGIRFIDRFEISGGLIRRQDVWNDLAEIKARESGG